MKKKIALVCTATVVTLAAAGCNSGSVTSEFMDKLEEQVSHNTSYIKEETASTTANMEAVIDGSETENIVMVLADTSIMNKPSDEGTIVGEVKKNESVLLIGDDSTGGWYKVAYNGRVCYVKGTKLDIQTIVADTDENDTSETSTSSSDDENGETSTTVAGGQNMTSGTSSENAGQTSTSNTSGGSSGQTSTTHSGGQTVTAGGNTQTSTGGSITNSTSGNTGTTSSSGNSGEISPTETTTIGNGNAGTTQPSSVYVPSETETTTPQESQTSETETTSATQPTSEKTTAPTPSQEESTSYRPGPGGPFDGGF